MRLEDNDLQITYNGSEMVSAELASKITSITVKQLANWRMPSRSHTAPFKHYNYRGLTLYKLKDLLIYIEPTKLKETTNG